MAAKDGGQAVREWDMVPVDRVIGPADPAMVPAGMAP